MRRRRSRRDPIRIRNSITRRRDEARPAAEKSEVISRRWSSRGEPIACDPTDGYIMTPDRCSSSRLLDSAVVVLYESPSPLQAAFFGRSLHLDCSARGAAAAAARILQISTATARSGLFEVDIALRRSVYILAPNRNRVIFWAEGGDRLALLCTTTESTRIARGWRISHARREAHLFFVHPSGH